MRVKHVERLGHEAFAYGALAGDADAAMFCARVDGPVAVDVDVALALSGTLHAFDKDGARITA
jgi:hypothetical protein